jgi:hypothetical protein
MKTRTFISLFFAALLPLTACLAEAEGTDETGVFEDETSVSDEDAAIAAQTPQLDSTKLAQLAAFVGIPSNYVYNPRLGTLHDYCTKSPDEFPNPVGGNANFRGPCARHDLCLEARRPSQGCNNALWSDMVSNCVDKYSWFNPARQACINTAHVYWVAVTVNTHI